MNIRVNCSSKTLQEKQEEMLETEERSFYKPKMQMK